MTCCERLTLLTAVWKGLFGWILYNWLFTLSPCSFWVSVIAYRFTKVSSNLFYEVYVTVSLNKMLLDLVFVYLQAAFSVIRLTNLWHSAKALIAQSWNLPRKVHYPNITALAALMHHWSDLISRTWHLFYSKEHRFVPVAMLIWSMCIPLSYLNYLLFILIQLLVPVH